MKALLIGRQLMQDRLAHYKEEAETYRKRAKKIGVQDDAFYWGYYLGKARVARVLLDTALSTTINEKGVRITKRRK